MNFYSSAPTSNAYATTTPSHHHPRHHDIGERVTQSASAHSAREASSTSMQPPFLLYPEPTKPIIYQASSMYKSTTGDHNRVLPPPPPSYPSLTTTKTQRMAASPDPSGISPQTPPPRVSRQQHGCIVSPPAPLRITTFQLQYQRIGPAHLQIYRLSLPLDLKLQLDPIVAQAEAFSKSLANGWHTDLYSLTKQDIALLDIPGMRHKIRPIFDYLCHAIRTLYGCQKVVVDKNQPHILKYSVDSGHTGVELHHDRCDVTANLALSRSGDYCGGGTYIPDTGSVIKLNHGECLLHPGSLVHGGMEVTKGTRYLMVTFAHLR